VNDYQAGEGLFPFHTSSSGYSLTNRYIEGFGSCTAFSQVKGIRNEIIESGVHLFRYSSRSMSLSIGPGSMDKNHDLRDAGRMQESGLFFTFRHIGKLLLVISDYNPGTCPRILE
jgi:hypothetical protein